MMLAAKRGERTSEDQDLSSNNGSRQIAVCQILQTGPYLKKDGRKTGVFLTKIRALDGRKDGRRRAKLKFLFSKKPINSTRNSSLGYTG